MHTRELLALTSIAILLVGKLIPRLPAGYIDAALVAHVVVTVLWIAFLAGSAWAGPAPLLGPWRPRWVPVGAALGVGIIVLGMSGYVISQRILGLSPPPEAGLVAGGPAPRLITVLGIALAAAVLEEWVFRGVLLDRLDALPRWATVFGSAAIFAAYHVSLFQLLPTLLVGIVLAISVSWLGSLWPAVIAHVVFNITGLALSVLSTKFAQPG